MRVRGVSYRWAWFALACLLALVWVWTTRYEAHPCSYDNRVICLVNRWTGAVELRRPFAPAPTRVSTTPIITESDTLLAPIVVPVEETDTGVIWPQ